MTPTESARRRLDLAAYRALGVLQALYSAGGIIPPSNAAFVAEIIKEHDDARAELDAAMAQEAA